MTTETLPIKPHHFVDILCALGDGTESFVPHPYGHAVHVVAQRLLAAPHTRLRIELQADAICGPCCHNIDGLCDDSIDTTHRPAAPRSKRAWNLLIDQRWCRCLGIRQDDSIEAIQLCTRIHTTLDSIPEIYREIIDLRRTMARRQRLEKGVARFIAISHGI